MFSGLYIAIFGLAVWLIGIATAPTAFGSEGAVMILAGSVLFYVGIGVLIIQLLLSILR